MRPEKSSITELAIPSRGFSTRYPLAKMPPEFCAWLCDYEIGAGYLESRKGLRDAINADVNFSVGHYSHPTNSDLIIDVDTFNFGRVGYFNPKTSARGFYGAWTSPGTGVSYKARPIGINEKVLYFFEGHQPMIFDGTASANTGLSGPTLANLVFGVTFKGHLWAFEHLSQSGWFHPTVNGVAGALTQLDLSAYTQDNGIVMCAFGFTLSSGLQSQSLFAFVFDSGEVIAYSGDYPGGTWAIVGTRQIGAPLGYQSIIRANGDVYVMTRNGVTSMRSLFVGGEGSQATITGEIEKYWQQAIMDIDALDSASGYDPRTALISNTCGAYHQTRNELYIFLPRFLKPASIDDSEITWGIDTETNSTMALVYDLSAAAWRAVKIPEIEGQDHSVVISSFYSARFDLLLFSTDSTMVEVAFRLFRPEYYDTPSGGENVPITPELRTSFVKAPRNFNCGGVLLTHSGETKIKSAVDVNLVTEFGKTASSACSVVTASGVSEEFYNVGAESKSFQAVVSLSTPTDGTMTKPHQIVDISLMLEPGGSLG